MLMQTAAITPIIYSSYCQIEYEGYNSSEKMPKFEMKAPMLMQTAAIYTHKIFQSFQIEHEEFQSAYITCRKGINPTHECLVATSKLLGIPWSRLYHVCA